MHCIIVGSGCSGLTTGILLAKAGYQVTILEQHKNISPTIAGFTRQGKYYDTGLHCLGGIAHGGSLRAQFHKLGILPKVNLITSSRENSFSFKLASGKEWLVPQSFEDVVVSLSKLFPEELKIRSFFTMVEKLSQQFQYGNEIESAELEAVAEKPLVELLESYFSSKELQLFLECLSISFCGLTRDEVSFGFYSASTGTYFHSYGSIEGGGKQLSAIMVEEFTACGGDILTGAEVCKIHLNEHKIFQSVQLQDSSTLEGDVLVSSCHPRLLEKLLPLKALRPTPRKYLQELESSRSIFAVFGSCPSELTDKIGNILFFSEGNKDPVTFFSGSDGTFALMQASVYLDWQKFAGSGPFKREKGYREKKDCMAEQLVEVLYQQLPQLQGHVQIVSVSTPLTIKDHCFAPQGTSYGVKQSVQQWAPMPRLALGNVFLTGQALSGPGIQGAMTSGFITADTIINQQKDVQ